jgi:hypothetical protein
MRDGEALDLARYGSLTAAFASIEKRIEINQQFPDSRLRNALAVQEAAILAGATPGSAAHALNRVLKAREAAFDSINGRSHARTQSARDRASLRQQMEEIRRWGRNHSRFVREMNALYLQRTVELKLLNLPEDVAERAQADLNQLFEAALQEL